MVITVTCPSCSSSFPVDTNKVPEGGVNARCTKCGDIFRIEKPADPPPPMDLPAVVPAEPTLREEPATPPPLPRVAEAPSESEPELPEIPAAESAEAWPTLDAEDDTDPFAESAPFEAPEEAAPELPPIPEPELPPIPEPDASVETQPPPVQGFTFGKRDPTDKARRLARVLVSDMIMYNADRHQSALAAGTLVQDFDEEIQKSWKEYVDQVGEEMANGDGRAFWTNALNEILAKGQNVF